MNASDESDCGLRALSPRSYRIQELLFPFELHESACIDSESFQAAQPLCSTHVSSREGVRVAHCSFRLVQFIALAQRGTTVRPVLSSRILPREEQHYSLAHRIHLLSLFFPLSLSFSLLTSVTTWLQQIASEAQLPYAALHEFGPDRSSFAPKDD